VRYLQQQSADERKPETWWVMNPNRSLDLGNGPKKFGNHCGMTSSLPKCKQIFGCTLSDAFTTICSSF